MKTIVHNRFSMTTNYSKQVIDFGFDTSLKLDYPSVSFFFSLLSIKLENLFKKVNSNQIKLRALCLLLRILNPYQIGLKDQYSHENLHQIQAHADCLNSTFCLRCEH